jgi:Zn-dependent protease with chaperone function
VTLPYFQRLLCLCLASFFILHLSIIGFVSSFSKWAAARAERMRPHTGARFLLALRLLPVALATFAVAALCAPSYLWLEPDAAPERVGIACLIAAAMGAAVGIAGLARAIRAAIRSRRFVRECRPVLILAGVFRPRVVVSTAVRKILNPDQLTVALCHEEAHRVSRDNLKRLLILLAPDLIPGLRPLRALDAAWSRMAEWAADDLAVGNSPERRLDLASALLRVARLGSTGPTPELATSLLDDSADLARRVERLLQPAPAADPARPPIALLALAALAVVAAVPAALPSVHRLLEALAH